MQRVSGEFPTQRAVIRPVDRILLLLAVLLASYQVVVGIEGFDTFSTTSYTVGFGVLLVAGLLLIILGFEVLESAHVVVISTIIPLSLSTGLIDNFLPVIRAYYLAFAVLAFTAVVVTRCFFHRRAALVILTAAHAVSGMLIFILPVWVCLDGAAPWRFSLVSLGGALIGLYGVLLSLVKADRPLLSQEKLLTIFPLILLLTTAAFTAGFTVV
jgi:hypothetical protein